ncbi:MAG: hypothetical protein E7Z73_06995, partial [Methanobrevibacter millerae]
MNKKIFILLFFLFVLISMSAVSAADLDSSNDTIALSNDAEAIAIANDVNAIDDLNENYSDGDGKALENDAKSVAADKNNENDLLSLDNDENGNILKAEEGNLYDLDRGIGEYIITATVDNQEINIPITAAPPTWYVNASKTSSGDGKSEETAFKTLKEALDVAEDGDTIMIASGEYKGTDNTELSIYRNLNFVKYGDGEAIFDAESQRRIWTVMNRFVNIIGLTFKNGNSTNNGGAIYMRGGDVINCTFIDNTAATKSTSYGGAIYCLYYTNVTNCNFTGNYARYMGGAFYTMRGGNVSDCIFTGNNVNSWGGAIGLETADNTEGTVTNCAFFNNTAKYGKAISSSRVLKSIDNNWWGSNNPDWNELINTAGIPSSYAVLNVTADTQTIAPGSKARLNYAFYRNGTTEILSIPERAITLSATGGNLDDTSGYMVNGEFSTEFSADTIGDYEITAMVDNQEIDIPITVAIPTWYVNASKTSSGDGKSEETAFMTLNEAIDAADDGDIIMIASGTYTGDKNVGLEINNNGLTLNKYGGGEAIFDAQGNEGILTLFRVPSININGLTFKNSGSHALFVNGDLCNSTINATFINNTAGNCGAAIRFWGDLDNVNVSGKFIGNTITYDGGAIYVGSMFNSNICATFINNTASRTGVALCVNSNLDNVNISGNFINNVGGNEIIYIGGSISNSVIQDSIFINNDANKIITAQSGIQTINNWFGNNATNYNIDPNVGIDLDNWLFLNATADPSEIGLGKSSTITFDMYTYSDGFTYLYNKSMNIQLDLTQTLGELDKPVASLGEEITYTAKDNGNASVTGTFETASQTIRLTNNDPIIPTEIKIANSTVDLKANDEIESGATLTPADAGNVTYTSSNSSVAVVVN